MADWARSGEHPDYPEAEYITAYGLARTVREATELAEGGLESRICHAIITEHKALFKDTQFDLIVREPAAWFQLAEFESAIRSDAASNGFEAVVLRAIKRNELKLRARPLLTEARSELAAEPPPPIGIGSIQRRLEMWGRYFLLAVRVVGLELLVTGKLDNAAFDKVEEALLALWELPTIMRTEQRNSGQHYRLKDGLAKPLELYAGFRGQPVADVPITWGAAAGFTATIEGDRTLDANGRATAKVLYFAATGDEVGYVQARIDLDRVVGRRLGISMNVWLWHVVLPARANAELVINLTETLNREPLAERQFTPEIKDWAVMRNLACAELTPSDNDEYHYHLILEGNVDVTTSTSNDIATAYVSGVFTLTDLETGTVLFRYTLGLKRDGQLGSSEIAVRMLALKDGAADVMAEMAARISATLPAKQ
jgi:hypothetical protein